MKVGLCGVGRMGAVMGERLIESGHDIVVWNRTPEKAEPLTALGARQVSTAAALASECDTVLSILADDDALDAAYAGDAGLLSGDATNRLFIEMSTVRPATIRRIGDAARQRGHAFLECPVSGSVGPARNGKLLGMAGGNPEDLERARPVLDVLCRRVEHVGPLGAGAAMKLAVNLPLNVYWEAVGEALSFADRAGIDTGLAISILTDTSGAIPSAAVRLPPVVEALNGRTDGPVGFTISGTVKDLDLMCDFAAENGIEAPVLETTRRCYRQAAGSDEWTVRNGPLMAAWRVERNRRGMKA